MRKKIVAGNWKMNMGLSEGAALVSDILETLPPLDEQRQVIIAPPYIHLAQTVSRIQGTDHISVAAQNCHHEQSGAYTGEISAAMLRSAEVSYVIIGHSERREYNGETDEQLARKTDAALNAGLKVIFCCGEPLEVRDADTQNDFVEKQIQAGLFHLSAAQFSNISIAYEPIWAIGTGRTASAQQAQDMHAHIRSVLAARYGAEIADHTSILYGGSCKPSNAAELFACNDVDGGLIGGASLKAEDFTGIIQALVAAQ
jgi:triosephosphate isomerase